MVIKSVLYNTFMPLLTTKEEEDGFDNFWEIAF